MGWCARIEDRGYKELVELDRRCLCVESERERLMCFCTRGALIAIELYE